MAKSKKTKPPVGKYVSQKDAALLKKAQKMRLVFMYLSTLTLAVTLFLPLEWAEYTKDILWLQSLYVGLIAVMVTVSVIASYGASRGCNITGSVSEKHKPKRGFEKGTFISVEWFMYLHFLLAAGFIAVNIYAIVSYGGKPFDLLATVLACAGAALAYMFRLITFRAFKDDLTYVPPSAPTKPDEENTIAKNDKAQSL